RGPDGPRQPPRRRGPHPGGARAGQLPAPRVGRGTHAPGRGRRLGRAGPGGALARHDRRRGHAPARHRGAAGQRVVGPAARGAGPDALWRPGSQRPARRRDRRQSVCRRHRQNGAGAAGAGAGGIRHMSVLTTVVTTTDLAILVYFLVLNSFYAVLLIFSIPEIWEQTRLAEDEDFQRLMQSDALPPITILVP